jgi:hypothetical protein
VRRANISGRRQSRTRWQGRRGTIRIPQSCGA